jgi:hypothetical protein
MKVIPLLDKEGLGRLTAPPTTPVSPPINGGSREGGRTDKYDNAHH